MPMKKRKTRAIPTSVHVVVIEAEAEGCVSGVGIKGQRAEEMFSCADACAGCGAVFPAQAVEARGQRLRQSSIDMHRRGLLVLQTGFREEICFRGEFKIVLVCRKLFAVARHVHAVFELPGEAPGFPPQRFDLQ